MSFEHDGSETAAGSFSVSLSDSTSAPQSRTVTAAVTPANDDPILAGDLSITVAEGGTVAVSAADLSASDPDSTDAQLVYTVTGTSHVAVLRNEVVLFVGETFTQADLAANLVTLQHDGGEDDGSFAVSLTDGIAPAQSRTVTVTVNAAAFDPPTSLATSPSRSPRAAPSP